MFSSPIHQTVAAPLAIKSDVTRIFLDRNQLEYGILCYRCHYEACYIINDALNIDSQLTKCIISSAIKVTPLDTFHYSAEKWPRYAPTKRLLAFRDEVITELEYIDIVFDQELFEDTDFFKILYSMSLNYIGNSLLAFLPAQRQILLKSLPQISIWIRESLEINFALNRQAFVTHTLDTYALLGNIYMDRNELELKVGFYQSIVNYHHQQIDDISNNEKKENNEDIIKPNLHSHTEQKIKVIRIGESEVKKSYKLNLPYPIPSYRRFYILGYVLLSEYATAEEIERHCILLQYAYIEKKDLNNKLDLFLSKLQNQPLADENIDLPDQPILASFLRPLYSLSQCLDEESKQKLWALFKRDLTEYLTNNKSCFYRTVLFSCKDILYGFNVEMTLWPIFKKAADILDKLFQNHTLISHTQAQTELLSQLFQQNSSLHSSALCQILYKTWWYTPYLRNKVISLTNLLLDWHATDILIEKRSWGLNCEDFISIVRDLFRRDYPAIPFCSVHAQTIYFKLSSAYKKKQTP